MKQENVVIGLGSAYVEAKIRSSERLPAQREQLPTFLDSHPEASLYAGGSVPNILTSFARVSGNPNIRLLSYVGNDSRGRFYLKNMERLLGEPKITQRPTDLWVGIYDSDGLVEGMDLYGAIRDLSLSKEDITGIRNRVFITDIDACRFQETQVPIKQALDQTADDGVFALSLVGANPEEDISQIIAFTGRAPEVVFGNTYEILSITHETDLDRAIKMVFPSNRLVIITQAEKGALIRLDNDIFSIPAMPVPKERVIDETGAGDSYMGTMLALLLRKTFNTWQKDEIIKAAQIASYASTLVIQSMNSRVTPSMSRYILSYAK